MSKRDAYNVAWAFARQAKSEGWPNKEIGREAARRYNGELPKERLLKALRDGIRAGKELNELEADDEQPLAITRASDVRPLNIKWAWDHLIPLRKTTLLVGPEGIGKGLLFAWLAARLTNGELAGDLLGKPSTVLMASREDDPADTLVPRLMAAGADLSRVAFLKLHKLPDDVKRLERRMEMEAARVVLIDTVSSYIGDVNEDKDARVRQVLDPLTELAARIEAALVLLRHVNKRSEAEALQRVLGSRAWSAAPRSVLFFGREPHAREERGPDRILAQGKINVGRDDVPSRLFHVKEAVVEREDDGEQIVTARVDDVGESAVSSDQLMHAMPDENEQYARMAAVGWLEDFLRSGARPRTEVLDKAKRAGHAPRTVYRAAEKLRVQSQPMEGDRRQVAWKLPRKERKR